MSVYFANGVAKHDGRRTENFMQQANQEWQEYICQEDNPYLESLIREEVIMFLEDND